jgi:hypothetical protein
VISDLEMRKRGAMRPVRIELPVWPASDVLGVREMLLYEALARIRMREAEENASRHRLVRRLVAGRRWARLARYAAERAERTRLTD